MTDNPLDSLLFDETDVLERVDEYSLYCRYLKYEPLIGGKYRSPIRPNDDDPSFGIYERKYGHGANEFLWKDQAAGIHGDIFDLVARIYNITKYQAVRQICSDVNMMGTDHGAPQLVEYEPQYTSDINIRILSRKMNYRDITYWNRYNVDAKLLKDYNVTALQNYWLVLDQQYPSYPKGLGFAYRIWDKYQLYFPNQEKAKKFRNNWTDICVPGFLQLRYNSPLCIVTKAYKDVMFLRSLGYEAVAPKSETTMLPELCISHLQKKYTRIVTLFDNDGKHKAKEYPFEELHVPLESETKDPTDFCDRYGVQASAEMLTTILTP